MDDGLRSLDPFKNKQQKNVDIIERKKNCLQSQWQERNTDEKKKLMA